MTRSSNCGNKTQPEYLGWRSLPRAIEGKIGIVATQSEWPVFPESGDMLKRGPAYQEIARGSQNNGRQFPVRGKAQAKRNAPSAA